MNSLESHPPAVVIKILRRHLKVTIATTVDAEDAYLFERYKWGLQGRCDRPYVSRAIYEPKQKTILLSRVIMGANDDECVDHINGNTLDNRRCNLRICSKTENMRNRRKLKNSQNGVIYKGVQRRAQHKWIRYVALVTFEGRRFLLGYFTDQITAALCYDLSSVYFFGEFARPNFNLAVAQTEYPKQFQFALERWESKRISITKKSQNHT